MTGNQARLDGTARDRRGKPHHLARARPAADSRQAAEDPAHKWRRLVSLESFTAGCSCGWVSPERKTFDEMTRDVDRHLDAVGQSEGPRDPTGCRLGIEPGPPVTRLQQERERRSGWNSRCSARMGQRDGPAGWTVRARVQVAIFSTGTGAVSADIQRRKRPPRTGLSRPPTGWPGIYPRLRLPRALPSMNNTGLQWWCQFGA